MNENERESCLDDVGSKSWNRKKSRRINISTQKSDLSFTKPDPNEESGEKNQDRRRQALKWQKRRDSYFRTKKQKSKRYSIQAESRWFAKLKNQSSIKKEKIEVPPKKHKAQAVWLTGKWFFRHGGR